MKRHLVYHMQGASVAGEDRHPQLVMRALGITYVHATPQSIYDSWWFWGCEPVPDPLPPYLRPLGVKPHDAIGWGLSAADAAAIVAACAS